MEICSHFVVVWLLFPFDSHSCLLFLYSKHIGCLKKLIQLDYISHIASEDVFLIHWWAYTQSHHFCIRFLCALWDCKWPNIIMTTIIIVIMKMTMTTIMYGNMFSHCGWYFSDVVWMGQPFFPLFWSADIFVHWRSSSRLVYISRGSRIRWFPCMTLTYPVLPWRSSSRLVYISSGSRIRWFPYMTLTYPILPIPHFILMWILLGKLEFHDF